MSPLDQILYKTRKSVLEALTEIGHNDISVGDISLEQCNSCGIWLKSSALKLDLDGYPICNECFTFYGP